MPKRSREHYLNCIAAAAATTGAKYILIGGACSDNSLFIENQVARWTQKFQLRANSNLCVLARAHDETTLECFSLDTEGPHFMITIIGKENKPSQISRNAAQPLASGSAERPAPINREAEQPVACTSATPLYDTFIAHMETDANNMHALVSCITFNTFNSFSCGFETPLEH